MIAVLIGISNRIELPFPKVLKEKAMSVIILRDFVRLVEGVIEIGEDHSLGLKSLKESVYLKAANRVEFENWWKELSSFVPSQMKRAFSKFEIDYDWKE